MLTLLTRLIGFLLACLRRAFFLAFPRLCRVNHYQAGSVAGWKAAIRGPLNSTIGFIALDGRVTYRW